MKPISVVTGLLISSLSILSTRADTLVEPRPEIKVQAKVPLKATAFELSRVRLLDGPFKRAMQADADYLLDINPDRLLSRFREYSGLPPKASIYKGWEAMTISGHSLGHYLSAISMMHASTGDKRFLERVNYIVDELALAQNQHQNGFVGGFPEADRIWKEIAGGEIKTQPFDLNGIWVPWYTTHKLFAGLTDAYLLCDSAKARDIMVRLADWTISLTDKLSDEQMQQMMATEHGGVLESFTDVYALTGDAKYLNLSQRWYHKRFMDPLAERKDSLTGLHGNTNIPKVIGAARQYQVTGDEKFRTIAEFFWDNVVNQRSYVIGGHGDDEHFFPPDRFNEHVTSHAAETCNTYNMLKLTRHLFSWSASARVADFYERALYNHILASQEPRSGMMIYLCSLRPGHIKVFNSPYDSFWCCTGTGMENHAKYGDSIYFRDNEGLYVNLFVASELDWREKGLKVRQETTFPETPTTRLNFTADRPVDAAIRIRHPWWAEEALRVSVNGQPASVTSKAGEYAVVTRKWKSGDRLEVTFPMRLRVENLPGDSDQVALLYGPVVMAGALGQEGMEFPMPIAKDRMDYDTLPAPEVPVMVSAQRDPNQWFRPVDGKPLTFAANDGVFRNASGAKVDAPELKPFYEIWDQRYTVYWHAFTPDGWKQKESELHKYRERLEALGPRLIDEFRPGEIQPEREHNVQGERSAPGEFELRRNREATRGGWFSFDMKVDPARPVEIVCTYWGDQANRTFDILVNNEKIATQALNRTKPGEFFEVAYAIPESVTKGKEKVTVKFQTAQKGRGAGPLFKAYTLRKQ
jgi:hypothetical protein